MFLNKQTDLECFHPPGIIDVPEASYSYCLFSTSGSSRLCHRNQTRPDSHRPDTPEQTGGRPTLHTTPGWTPNHILGGFELACVREIAKNTDTTRNILYNRGSSPALVSALILFCACQRHVCLC